MESGCSTEEATMTERVRIPRDADDDYTAGDGRGPAALRRRAAPAPRSSTSAATRSTRSSLPATSRTSSASRRCRSALAGPLRIDGEHASGEFYIPMATTRGNARRQLQPRHAPADRERRRARRRSSRSYMQRAPVFIFDDALAGARVRRRGSTSTSTRSSRPPSRRPASASCINIGQYSIGPLRYLRFNYTTGDAAGQNMTGKATLAACEWIKQNYPGRREVHPVGQHGHRQEALAASTCC